ncbi:MAG: amino acid ABC transporter ATP-binding protein [Acidobacteria bacterium]|nr:amino acid ABC transporter ATP-binding protein [Acidobacteriota bacterium]
MSGDATSVLRVRDLRLKRGARTILDGVSVEIRRGEVVALMGASGSGKTTMLRSMAGLEPFESGAIEVGGVTLGGGRHAPDTLRALRTKVGMVFQFHCLFEHLTAIENVWLAPVHVHGAMRAEAEARGMELLGQLGVAHRATALPRELSGGEAQRVAIARALATDPPVLLMDEPTASLDPARRDELARLVQELVTRGRTIVAATHDEEFAERGASRIIRMASGRVSADVGRR